MHHRIYVSILLFQKQLKVLNLSLNKSILLRTIPRIKLYMISAPYLAYSGTLLICIYEPIRHREQLYISTWKLCTTFTHRGGSRTKVTIKLICGNLKFLCYSFKNYVKLYKRIRLLFTFMIFNQTRDLKNRKCHIEELYYWINKEVCFMKKASFVHHSWPQALT